MPVAAKLVISPMRGSEAYDAFLERLEAEAVARGHAVANRGALVEFALAQLGKRWKLPAPPRAQPYGTNRFGPPEKKSGKSQKKPS